MLDPWRWCRLIIAKHLFNKKVDKTLMVLLSLDMHLSSFPHKICIVLAYVDNLVEDRPPPSHLRRLVYRKATLNMTSSVHTVHVVVVVID